MEIVKYEAKCACGIIELRLMCSSDVGWIEIFGGKLPYSGVWTPLMKKNVLSVHKEC